MPATAKDVAAHLGVDYSKDRLGTDAAYNATLGAAFLGSLLARFDGSYAMSFAAYNAGAGRVEEWVKAHGDPRDPGTDVVDWIESIPIDETRNYVERTLENLQVYRARLGSPALNLAADLSGDPGYRPDPLATVVAAKQPAVAENPPPARPSPPRPALPSAAKLGNKAGPSISGRSTHADVIKVAQGGARRPSQSAQAARSGQAASKKAARRV
jgi:transglycosylase-like protein with SLT domain